MDLIQAVYLGLLLTFDIAVKPLLFCYGAKMLNIIKISELSPSSSFI